jgi:uncharacterized cofD-like protein
MITAQCAGNATTVVAVGGGHGLAVTLRAVAEYAASTIGVVSVADDGGSSGRLREDLGIPPPGDLRRCLVALASSSSPLPAVMEHRFTAGALQGHPVGNVLLAGFFEALGDVESALVAVGELLGARGLVLPATSMPVVLVAKCATGTVRGQSTIMATPGIEEVSHAPADPLVPERVTEAIEAADQLVLGPGSLYTSVIAAASVPAVRKAIGASRALKVYVANLRPQSRETEGYDLAMHVDALVRHGLEVDVVLADPSMPRGEGPIPAKVVTADLARPNGLAHDSAKLARELSALIG